MLRAILRTSLMSARFVSREVAFLATHTRLFVGLTLAIIGILSFASDRYCDGNTSVAYTCTRPATYYFYPSWAIGLVVVGAVLVGTWVLRREGGKRSAV